MIELGEVISYFEMCSEEGVNLQRGMNFRLGSTYSVILMSTRPGSPYEDYIQEEGKILIYEGHDEPKGGNITDPKTIDQPMYNPSGTLTQNGKFYEAAMNYKRGGTPEIVKVYEKIRSGIWTFNGVFRLADAWVEEIDNRKVFKFKLELMESQDKQNRENISIIDHPRVIPSWVKREVWKRDQGRCIICGSKYNLHFDHIIPYSKGGSSRDPKNIQLLCARHNLMKSDKIQ